MKESYFQYALFVLAVILALMLFAAVGYIGDSQARNEALVKENQELREILDEISEEIRILSDRIEGVNREMQGSVDWNEEAH